MTGYHDDPKFDSQVRAEDEQLSIVAADYNMYLGTYENDGIGIDKNPFTQPFKNLIGNQYDPSQASRESLNNGATFNCTINNIEMRTMIENDLKGLDRKHTQAQLYKYFPKYTPDNVCKKFILESNTEEYNRCNDEIKKGICFQNDILKLVSFNPILDQLSLSVTNSPSIIKTVYIDCYMGKY